MIKPGAWLGVLGGGQLARMFAFAAHRLGYRVMMLDPDVDCAAAGVVDRHVCASLDDASAWREIAKVCAAATIETENVPSAALSFLEQLIRVAPGANALAIAQDRATEKRFLFQHGLPVTPFRTLAGHEERDSAGLASLLPGFVKASRNGYDGKGQVAVTTHADVAKAVAGLDGDCVLEKRVGLKAELSVILARDSAGRMAVFPVPVNHHSSGILDVSVVPAPLPATLVHKAVALARRVARLLDYQGVLCVEFFVQQTGDLLINEIAPRPHNSGHFTIDACITSQFEQQVRVLADLPLGDPRLLPGTEGVAMANLLGNVWEHGEPDWRAAFANPRARLHLYAKQTARRGRKMGHLTCFAQSPVAAHDLAVNLRSRLTTEGVPGLKLDG